MLPASIRLVAIAIGFVGTIPARAQLELITYERPFHVRHLAGIIVDPSGAPISGVRVEVCDSLPIRSTDSAGNHMTLEAGCGQDPNRVRASTTTDVNGHFCFPKTATGRNNSLHLDLPGFDPMLIPVHIRLFARSELRIMMHVAT